MFGIYHRMRYVVKQLLIRYKYKDNSVRITNFAN